MTFSPTNRQAVLQELFDENSEPTHEEIVDYALRIGIDVENEGDLLLFARDLLLQPLPLGWSPCCDADKPDEIYYFNFKTGRAQWTHPLDEVHRLLVQKARGETTPATDQFEEDSRTTAKDDLISFEEAPGESSELLATTTEMMRRPRVLAPLGQGAPVKPPNTLGPLKPVKPPKKITFDDVEVKKRPNSSDIRNRRNIEAVEFRHLSKQDIIATRSPWRDEGYVTQSSATDERKELTLSGNGAMFLKKAPKVELAVSPKGILRKDSLEEAELESEKLSSVKDDDDDRKSVRFKLEKEIKVEFEVPGVSDSPVLSAPVSTTTPEPTQPSSDIRQIEIDFDDLILDLGELAVPKNDPKSAQTQEPMQDKSSRNYKKSINIVLNGKQAQEENNLIDLTEADSVSTVDSRKSEFGKILVESPPPHLKSQFNFEAKKRMFQQSERRKENASPKLFAKPKIVKGELLRISDSETSSHSVDDKIEELPNFEPHQNRAPLEVAKSEKLKQLEGDFNVWVKSTEKTFKDKEKQYYNHIKEKFEDWKKNQDNELIKWCAEERQGKLKALRNELMKEEQDAVDRLREELTTRQKERLNALKEDFEAHEKDELALLKISFEKSLAERKDELHRHHQDELARMERSLETLFSEQRSQRQLELETAREQEAILMAKRAELKDAFLQQKMILQQEHEFALQKIRQQHEADLKQVASSLRLQAQDQSMRLQDDAQRKAAQVNGKESSDPRVYEKLRCEKRLLEDKYKGLKEKYIRLKTDMKISLEKRAKKKDGAVLSASETDKSVSHRTSKAETDSPNLRRKTETDKKQAKKQLTNLDNVNQNVAGGEDNVNSKNCGMQRPAEPGKRHGKGDAEDSDDDENEREVAAATSRRRRHIFSKLKAASTSRLNTNNRSHEKDDTTCPVENLRRQLKKLEELEDEFPVTNHTDTYLRYPFSDAPTPLFASSELEFFKHRIHLERDSVRRAKEFLKAQKKCYENRQLELQHRLWDGGPPSKSVREQIHQEERELTEMEVSVHRTRALLGEKIIRLRHLEQSLRRVTPDRRPPLLSREDATLSDLSSHSDSSGFSSTHHNSEPTGPRPAMELSRRHLQTSMEESNEIIQSLENLNSEIRGIWEVLKQQSTGPGSVLLPPPPLAWPAVRSNPVAGIPLSRPLPQHIMTQVSAVSNMGHVTTVVDSSLAERTRSLRDWLKSARRSPNPSDPAATSQVTL